MKKLKLLLLISLGISLVSCTTNNHNYGTNYFYDETYHWQACSDSNCSATRYKGFHKYVIVDTKEATCTEDGYIQKACEVCGYPMRKEIISHHGHSLKVGYKNDETYHWQECENCTTQVSKTTHVAGDWVIDKEATVTENGLKHKQCTVCLYKLEEQVIPASSHIISSTWSSDEDYHWHACSHCIEVFDKGEHIPGDWKVIKEPSKTSTGLKEKRCKTCNYLLDEQEIPYLTSGTVDIYAVNDFHGEIEKLNKTMGYLKSKVSQGNTIVIDSGDAFQGSLVSNSNYGQLITKCMNEVGYSALTAGNHDFDWGIEKLNEIRKTSKTGLLGANIYKYDFSTKTVGTFDDEHFDKYVIKTLDNGMKIGIIGVIGKDQITSICSNLVQDITFVDPIPVIKTLSNELRNDKECDAVLLSCHGDGEDLLGSSYKTNTKSLEDYVDAVFLAHTHAHETYVVNGLQFIQSKGYGAEISNVKLNIDRSAVDKVTVTSANHISYSSGWTTDSACDALITNEKARVASEGNEVLSYNVPYLSKESAANLSAHSIAYEAEKQHYTIDLALVNSRASVYNGTLTYEKLYEAFPFDNRIYIAEVSGSDLINEVFWNQIYRVNPNGFSATKRYTIAVIDYLLFHTSSNRNYDYFSNPFTIKGELKRSGYSVYNYRFLLRDFLRENKDLDFTLYTSTNNRNDMSKIYSTVTF